MTISTIGDFTFKCCNYHCSLCYPRTYTYTTSGTDWFFPRTYVPKHRKPGPAQ